MKVRDMADLFNEEPWSFGLRGDVYLWKDMQRHFDGVAIPSSQDEFEGLIIEAFERLTEKPFYATDYFKIERYAHGGMSSGFIAPGFWQEEALPLLWCRASGSEFVWPRRKR